MERGSLALAVAAELLEHGVPIVSAPPHASAEREFSFLRWKGRTARRPPRDLPRRRCRRLARPALPTRSSSLANGWVIVITDCASGGAEQVPRGRLRIVITTLVSAPPLSDEQRARLAALFDTANECGR